MKRLWGNKMKIMNLIMLAIIITVVSAVTSFSQYAVKVVTPNGGEKLQVGTEVEITWEGIQPYQEVSLDYSTNGGTTWRNIYGYATGLKYKWKVPNDASARCLIRATVVDPISPAQWVRTAIGPGKEDIPVDIITDRKGNIYTCGVIGAPTIDFGNGPISNRDSSQAVYLAKYGPNGELLWVRTFMQKNNSWPSAITIDTLGNTYLRSFGLFEFGNNVVTEDLSSNDEDWTWSVASFDPNGNTRWAKLMSGFFGEPRNSIDCDSTGSLYACGSSQSDTIDFGNGVRLANKSQVSDMPNPSQEFIVKFDLDGKAKWARRIDSTLGDADGGLGISKIASDGTGRITVTGGYSKLYADFGNNIILKNSPLRNNNYIAQYTSDGDILWARNIESSAKSFFPVIGSVKHDIFKNIYLCGTFESPTLDFGNGVILKNLNASRAGFIAKYSNSGSILWAKAIQGEGDDLVPSITTDEFGDLYITGYTDSYELNFGNNLVMKTLSIAKFDYFLAKYDRAGNALWYKRAIGNGYDLSYAITIDDAKNLIITGPTYSTELNCGTGEVLTRNSTITESDLFIAKYTSDAPFGVSDTSDSIWSIIKPLAASLNIDMGRVLLGKQKDSVVTAFIRNVGDLPVDVRDIQLTGANASEFSILSG
ncbi:MAG TPA: SBBP repeat-containing protein, partial [Patescibacteria group bacterium]|nr:SBBP repeat-containing protein [Patescibacteria group bacterium]